MLFMLFEMNNISKQLCSLDLGIGSLAFSSRGS